jgi:hypothetical protein
LTHWRWYLGTNISMVLTLRSDVNDLCHYPTQAPVVHLNALCLVEKQQISILEFLNWLDHSTNSRSTSIEMITLTITGADLGFQVRGGALNKIAPSGGRRKNLWGISCEKSRFYAKKSYFFPILGRAHPPPLDPPLHYSTEVVHKT